MGSSEWDHDELVCSRACGLRLHRKIENGMVPRPPSRNPYASPIEDDERVSELRIRIKQLEHRLRARHR